MATQKRLNARIIPKHDIEANWDKAINFIPLKGEIIVYDADENYSYPRIKHGDGVTKVINLPFRELQINWNQTDDSQKDFIQNRPVYEDIVDVDYTRLPAFSNSLRTLQKSKDGLYASIKLDKKMNLVAGQNYTITVNCYYYDGTELAVDSWSNIIVKAQQSEEITYSIYNNHAIAPKVVKLFDEDNIIEIYSDTKLNSRDTIGLNNTGYCTYFIGDMYNDNYGLMEYIIHELPSKDCIVKQLPKHMVETEHTFNPQSLNPQSGIAVQEAINQSKPVVSDTLGDGHINIVDDDNGKTYLYTEGIGHNEDLNTFNKETIVDAINEVTNTLETSANKVVGKNIVTFDGYNGYKQLSLLSDEDLNGESPTIMYSYTIEGFQYEDLNADNKLFVAPSYNGLVQLSCDTGNNKVLPSFTIRHVDYNKQVTNGTNCTSPHSLMFEHLNKSKDVQFYVVQNVSTKKYVYNLSMLLNDGSTVQWNLNNATYKQSEVLYADNNQINNDHILIAPAIDSSGLWYSEQRYSVYKQAKHNIHALTVDENNFIILDTDVKHNEKLGDSRTNTACLTELSTNGKMFYLKSVGTLHELAVEDQTVGHYFSNDVMMYNGYITVLDKIDSLLYMVFIDKDTLQVVKKLPLLGLPTSFISNYMQNGRFTIVKDCLYLFDVSYTSCAGKINSSSIIMSEPGKFNRHLSDSLGDQYHKAFCDAILGFNTIRYSKTQKPYWISLKKELKFNEADPPKSINTTDTVYSDEGHLEIDNISSAEHKIDVSLDLTGKNLFDISKLHTTAEHTIYAYIKEVGNDYIIINTPEDTTANGIVDTKVKLRDLCPSLQSGKRYTLNAISESVTKTLYLLPIEQVWQIGSSITISEKMLDSQVYFYGLNPKAGQSTGDCKISNIMVTEGTQTYDYEPFFDVNNIELNIRTKNLIDLSTALLNTSTSSGSAVGNPVSFASNNARSQGNITFNKVMVQPNTQYTLSLDNSRYWLYRMFEMDINDGVVKHYPYYATLADNDKVTLTTQSNTSYLIIQLHYKHSLTVTENELTLTRLQLELGDDATEYVPYINETIYSDKYGKFDIPYAPSINLQLTDISNTIKVSYQKRLNNIYDDIISLQYKLDDICNKYETLLQQFNELKQSNNELSQQNIELNNIISEASDLLGGAE